MHHPFILDLGLEIVAHFGFSGSGVETDAVCTDPPADAVCTVPLVPLQSLPELINDALSIL